MFRHGSITLLRVRGVPIRAHWTLLLIIPYLAAALSYAFSSVAQAAGVNGAHLVLPPIAWGVVLAIGLFVSVALHELAHTLVAMHYGGRVKSITLMLVGGVSQLSEAPKRPLHEALMAAAGPATSFALGLVFAGGYELARGADVRMALFYLAAMNISLGAFNLLPAFPMDGGRVLRALLASRMGRHRATRIAARVGRTCAIVLGIVAILQLNLLLALVTLFVYTGAAREAVAETIEERLGGLRVTELLPKRPAPVIDADEHLDDVLRRMADLQCAELVVVDAQGPIGVIEAGDVSELSTPPILVPLRELAPRLPARFVVVPRAATAYQALQTAAEAEASYLVVVDPPSRVIGLVGPRDITRVLNPPQLGRLQPISN